VDGDQSVSEAHTLTETIENAIHQSYQRADILLHAEPSNASDSVAVEQKLRRLSKPYPVWMTVHDVQTHYFGSKLYVSAHVLSQWRPEPERRPLYDENIENVILTIVPQRRHQHPSGTPSNK